MTRPQKTNSAYEVLAEKVEDDVADQVRTFIDENDLESCIYLTDDSKRYYPYSTLAAQVVGFVNRANEGAYGLESLYNLELSRVGWADHHREERLGHGTAHSVYQL